MRLTQEQRRITEDRIRAAMDRLLRGDLPPGGKCDVKTLAAQSGVSRNLLYTTYAALREEFEARRDQLTSAGEIIDKRDEQIARLKQARQGDLQRISELEDEIEVLKAFKGRALSQIAAQHDEIERLRRQLNRPAKVVELHPPADRPHPPAGTTLIGPC